MRSLSPHDSRFILHTFYAIPTPIQAVRWLRGDALIRPSTKIMQSIGDFNLLCNFGGRNFKSPVCLSVTVVAVVCAISLTDGAQGTRQVRSHAIPRRVPILWHASGDSTRRLLSQPDWNDARGEILA